jgi:DNA-binding transcriptional regulator YdaS (Cro superfamily)
MEPQKNSLIERAIEIVGGKQATLAAAIGCAQQTISKLLLNEIRVSAEQAVAIHKVTQGQVSKERLRPDLFDTPAPRAGRSARPAAS